MNTPLYKRMKGNGSSLYVFPSAEEDFSSANQNPLKKVYFSKFALINIPKQITTEGVNDLDSTQNPTQLDFDNPSFNRLLPSNASNLADQMVESLRNYVANHIVTIRESKQGKDYFYDPNILASVSEKVFFKWCKKLNIIDFEPALANDEFFPNLDEFASKKPNDIQYFKETLWKEREIIDFPLVKMSQYDFTSGNEAANVSFLDLTFTGQTNLREGDYITFTFDDPSDLSPELSFLYRGLDFANEDLGARNYKVVQVRTDTSNNQIVTINMDVIQAVPNSSNGYDPLSFNSGGVIVAADFGTNISVRLLYTRLINYIGEISTTSNVLEGNRAYLQVYANIGAVHGKNPDILFRTSFDENYEPNFEYPFSPSQYQPEIVGAESFNSPIVQSPQNYPGDHYGYFDNENFYYTNSNGDELRRSGDYFGVFGTSDIPENTTYDPSKLDGITIDYDTAHYVKMNIINQEVSNFTDFSTLAINNEPPQDFEFNAILWYYTVEDIKGNIATNLYGIEFLQNPQNAEGRDKGFALRGIKFPTYKKLVSTEDKDGTSYSFTLNLNTYFLDEQTQPVYSATPINGLFSFELFNDAMIRLSSANENFTNIIAENAQLRLELNNLKSLIYSQTDLDSINLKIKFLEDLLKLYSGNQLISSDTVEVIVDDTHKPPLFTLNTTDSRYKLVKSLLATDLYSPSGIIPYHVPVPNGKDFMIRLLNDDTTAVTLKDNLMIILDKELAYKQSCTIEIDANTLATQNKRLDIILTASLSVPQSIVPLIQETPFILNLNLPIFYNTETNKQSPASLWKNIDLSVKMDNTISINDDKMVLPIDGYINGFKKGDYILLENFFVDSVDYSDQYLIDAVDTTNKTITIKYKSNKSLSEYVLTNAIVDFNTSSINGRIDSPIFISLNKGYTITITKIDDREFLDLKEKYFVKIEPK